MNDDEKNNELPADCPDSGEAELHAYQDALVRKGLKDVREGRVVSHEEVLRRIRETGRVRE